MIELAVVVVVAAVAWGAIEARKRVPRRATGSTGGAALAPPSTAFALGDVLTRGGEEAWLAGALELREGGAAVATIFVSPERRSHRAVVVFPAQRSDLLWLEPVEVAVGPEPPTTIELGGALFERAQRVPVEVDKKGHDAPDAGARALFCEYRGPGRQSLCVLACTTGALAWRGERTDLAFVLHLPSGAATLG